MAKDLTTFTELNGIPPNTWTFAGWGAVDSNSTTSVVYTDGQSVTDLSSGGNISLYCIFKRDITFISGMNSSKTDTAEQYYNPYDTSQVTVVEAPTLREIYNWTAIGYRNDTQASSLGTAPTSVTASITNTGTVSPTYNQTALTYYGIYSRSYTANFYSGVNHATTTTKESDYTYYNSNGASVPTQTTITLASKADSTDISNWTEDGWRDDTATEEKEYNYSALVTVDWGTDFYSLYSRILTISYNANGATGGNTPDTTKIIYLNSSSTTTSSQEVTLANNGFTWPSYDFTVWAVGSMYGERYAEGALYNPDLPYNDSTFKKTMYALWNGNYSVDDRPYLTLETAYNAVSGAVGNKHGTIITIRNNTDDSIFKVASGDVITLDTNKKTIVKSRYGIESDGELYIIGGGKITTVPVGE